MSNSNLAIRQRRTVPLDDIDDENDYDGEGGEDHSIHTSVTPRNEDSDSLRYSASHSRPRIQSSSSSTISKSSHSIRSTSSASGLNRSSSSRRIRRSDYHHQEVSSSRRRQRQQSVAGGETTERDSTSHRRSSRPLSSGGSGHSRGSIASAPSQINTDELKKRYKKKKNLSNSQRQNRSGGGGATNGGAGVGTKTPSTSRRNKLTIGDHSTNFLTMPLESNSDIQELLHGGSDIKDNKNSSKSSSSETPSQQKQRSITNSPVTGWKTPFEVDRPRGIQTKIPPAPLSSSDISIVSSDNIADPSLSEEQDAWAGIDNLLQSSTNSMDDSFVFSMCDILPRDTVQAMRKGRSSDASVITYGVDDNDDCAEEESVFDVVGRTGAAAYSSGKRSVSAMSKNSNGSGSSSHSGSRKDNKAISSSRKPNKKLSNSNDTDDNTQEGGDDQIASKRETSSTGGGGGGGNLFDVFHWSDKTNVDSTRQRTKKLNQTIKRSVSLSKPTSYHSTESDDMSMPSLASFRHDELNMSRRSTGSGWLGDSRHNYGGGDVSSVVTEDLHLEEFGGDNDDHGYDDDDEEFGYDNGGKRPEQQEQLQQELDAESTGDQTKSLAGDGLVLNKQVDDYIRKIQLQLPTISEDGGTISSPGGGNNNGGDTQSLVTAETSPSPTSIVEESPFDKLPSLASLSSEKVGLGGGSSSSSSTEMSSAGKQMRGGSSHSRKTVEKKEPKQSLSAQFMTSMSSIKGLGKLLPTGTKKQQAVANGDEEKYFPEPIDTKQSLKCRAGQSLLSEVNDGVNWD